MWIWTLSSNEFPQKRWRHGNRGGESYRMLMSSLMSKTCCQLPGGGESHRSTLSTNKAAKQKAKHAGRKRRKGEGAKREGKEREVVYQWAKSTEPFLIRPVEPWAHSNVTQRLDLSPAAHLLSPHPALSHSALWRVIHFSQLIRTLVSWLYPPHTLRVSTKHLLWD